MNNIDKVFKKYSKAIKDLDAGIRNQFAENVNEPWLKRDLKKRIREYPGFTFNDVREEAALLVQDEIINDPTSC